VYLGDGAPLQGAVAAPEAAIFLADFKNDVAKLSSYPEAADEGQGRL